MKSSESIALAMLETGLLFADATEMVNDARKEVLKAAAEMAQVNHVPACNCDVCAFRDRILRIQIN